MSQDNNITIVGNLTRDPELRYTTSGLAVLNLGIAVNHRKRVNGEWEEETSFFNVTAWQDLAENVAATLDKGNRAIVTGRLQQRSYETREGEKRNAVEIIADEIGPSLRWAQGHVERISRKQNDAGDGGGGASRAPDPVYGDDEEPF